MVPEAKIIFLSEESSGDIVQEAMSFGASGYVFKTMAAIDLLTAVETVTSGMKFVSIWKETTIPPSTRCRHCQSFISRSTTDKRRQIRFRNVKPYNATIQAGYKLRKYPDPGIVYICETAEVDDHLRSKFLFMSRPT
jgi:hypothetical protein